MAHSFMMGIVAHALPPRKGGALAHALSFPTWRYLAHCLCGHGRPVQSYAVPCFTGAVGSRVGLDAGVTTVGVGSVAVATTIAGAAAAGGGVAGVGFATTRTGALGVTAGMAPHAGDGGGAGTTRASARAGVRAAVADTGAGAAGVGRDGAGVGSAGASTHAIGAGRFISRRMARTDHIGRVRRSMGRASRAMATTRRRDEAARSSGNRRGTPASLAERLSRSGRRPNRPPGAAESPSP